MSMGTVPPQEPFNMWFPGHCNNNNNPQPPKTPARDQRTGDGEVLTQIKTILEEIKSHITSFNPKDLDELKTKISLLENNSQAGAQTPVNVPSQQSPSSTPSPTMIDSSQDPSSIVTHTVIDPHALLASQPVPMEIPQSPSSTPSHTMIDSSQDPSSIATHTVIDPHALLASQPEPMEIPQSPFVDTPQYSSHAALHNIAVRTSHQHRATHSLVNIFVFSVLLPRVKMDKWNLRSKLPSYQWEFVYEHLAAEDTDTVNEITDLLEDFGMTLNDFLWLVDFYGPECVSTHISNKIWIVLSYAPLLELIYSQPNNPYLQLFLACFENRGEPRRWWEFLAGITKSYKMEDGDVMEADSEAAIPNSSNIVNAWALQLQFGLYGIETEAVLNRGGIQLQWEHTHLVLAPQYAYVLDTRKVGDKPRSHKFNKTETLSQILDAALEFVGLTRSSLPRPKRMNTSGEIPLIAPNVEKHINMLQQPVRDTYLSVQDRKDIATDLIVQRDIIQRRSTNQSSYS